MEVKRRTWLTMGAGDGGEAAERKQRWQRRHEKASRRGRGSGVRGAKGEKGQHGSGSFWRDNEDRFVTLTLIGPTDKKRT